MLQDSSPLDTFESERPRLRALAYRMLGSGAEADDAVQETWLRYDRTDLSEVQNLAAWLTTVVSRVCLNLLRARQARHEESLESFTADWLGAADDDRIPQEEAELADSVGLAMLVVLDRLSPAERIAFVLHDMFDVAFDDIAHMMERSPAAVRQLASRARAKVRGTTTRPADAAHRRHAVEAYLAATRTGDFAALLTLLDPEIELRADASVTGAGRPLTLHGALAVARSALSAAPRANFTVLALVDGSPALVMAPLGRLSLVIRFVFDGTAISSIDIIADPERLHTLEITLV
ncbi:RNA polymerase sigma-70 factor, ECF subfamily [Nonomuraea maritima]|uniref:RNA polymerase sigma-70 factor, ECF subfamily n=1 Tax=Nonomuraea maritima TaxID=683260 RepID=A0A1G8Z1Y0_9ACTN|nr:sigma-70 family RNA polymerase sigma factor [Nonomuraea maritima]SDK09051.1 RNA polymerase sigma-70 factor, ECF subfamily [Nonomuraea maritima]